MAIRNEDKHKYWAEGRFVALGGANLNKKHYEIDRAIQETLDLFADAPSMYSGGSWIYDLRAYFKATAKRFNAMSDLMRMLYSGKTNE